MALVKPKTPPPKPRPQCSVAGFLQGLPADAFDNPVLLTGGAAVTPTKGLVTGKTIAVNGTGAGIKLTGDLILISERDLTIDGDILFPNQNNPKSSNVNLILASLRGTVTVRATVGKGHAPPGKRQRLKRGTRARADAGENGGYIL